MPITSTRTPGKTSSASISVLMPLSAISGPTNRAPARASLMRRPAPDPVLDLRRALGFVLEGGVWFINLYLDLPRLHLRTRLFLRGFGFAFVARARLDARVATLADEQLRAEIADVPGREVALRKHVRPGPVEQRGLAVVIRLVERGARFRRRAALQPAQPALQPLAAARNLEVGGAEARLAEAGKETRVVGCEHSTPRVALGFGHRASDCHVAAH